MKLLAGNSSYFTRSQSHGPCLGWQHCKSKCSKNERAVVVRLSAAVLVGAVRILVPLFSGLKTSLAVKCPIDESVSPPLQWVALSAHLGG